MHYLKEKFKVLLGPICCQEKVEAMEKKHFVAIDPMEQPKVDNQCLVVDNVLMSASLCSFLQTSFSSPLFPCPPFFSSLPLSSLSLSLSFSLSQKHRSSSKKKSNKNVDNLLCPLTDLPTITVVTRPVTRTAAIVPGSGDDYSWEVESAFSTFVDDSSLKMSAISYCCYYLVTVWSLPGNAWMLYDRPLSNWYSPKSCQSLWRKVYLTVTLCMCLDIMLFTYCPVHLLHFTRERELKM